MRWLFSSWGSRGDLHPFLALGRGLVARGHQVTLVGHPEWGEETEAAGLRFVSTGEPSREDFIRTHPELLSAEWGGLVSLHALVNKAIAPTFDHNMEVLLAEAPGHDVLVAHHFAFPAAIVAELAGLPLATVTLAPAMIPSAYYLPGAAPFQESANWAERLRNRFIWSSGRWISAQVIDPVVNGLRTRHGLRPARDLVFSALSKRLNLQLYSEHFAPRAPDWSAEIKHGGFCFYDPPAVKELPPEIEAFLGRGEPPVLFTLGSLVVQLPGPFFEHAVETLQALSLRGILMIGEEENRPAHLPESILAAPYLPYGLIMPRVKAVVHQCGIGTLSHSLRAGVPSVAYPFAFDQPNNAQRLKTLGLAEIVPPLDHRAKTMRHALEKLLSGQAPARARQMSEKIRAEDGVGKACDVLEQAFGASR